MPEINGSIFTIYFNIMKRLKTAGLALAMVLGVSGAFVSHSAHAASKNDPSYNWQEFDRLGNPSGTLTDVTEEQAEHDTGCSTGTLIKCAVTTNAPEPITIYYKSN